jgi:hypothetical protein
VHYCTSKNKTAVHRLVYEVVSRREPHAERDVLEVAKEIRDKLLTPEIPKDCPEKLRQVMQMCWKKQSRERPVSFEAICEMLEK